MICARDCDSLIGEISLCCTPNVHAVEFVYLRRTFKHLGQAFQRVQSANYGDLPDSVGPQSEPS